MDHRALRSEELNPGSTMVNGVPHSPNTFLDIRVQNGQLVRTLLQQIDNGHGRSRSRKNVELQQSSMDGPAPRANLPSEELDRALGGRSSLGISVLPDDGMAQYGPVSKRREG